MACAECLPWCPWLRRRATSDESSQLVDFLATVPFFQAQLPPGEIYRVASRVKRRTWSAGATVVAEGKVPGGFYVIFCGEATVSTSYTFSGTKGFDAPVHVAKLQAGDTFGGRGHIRQLKADFSVKAGRGLVTLALTRKDLDELGLSTKLRFPKRAGMYEGVFARDMGKPADAADAPGHAASSPSLPLSARDARLDREELEFVAEALRGVPNLRALVSTDEDWASRLAGLFTKRQVPKDTEVATAGKPGNEFFIVAEGSIGVFQKSAGAGPKTAEAGVHAEKLEQLISRRHEFLQQLSAHDGVPKSRGAVATSVWVHAGSGSRAAARRPTNDAGDDAGVAVYKVASEAGGIKAQKRRKTLPVSERQLSSEDAAAGDRDAYAEVLRGGTFGEMAVLYGVNYLSTARALQDSTLYAIRRHHFQTLRRERDGAKLDDYCKLLDEVKLLVPLIHSDRRELARNAAGMFEFRPGECVLEEGKPRAQPKWYVVAKGSCSISRRDAASGETQQLGQLYHGSHFGERSILRGDECSEFTAHAGTEGLTVLAFDRDILKLIASRLDLDREGHSPGSLSNIAMSAKPDEYMKVVCSDMRSRGVTGDWRPEPAGNLEPVSRLGEGGFGDVFLVRSRVTQQRYALKQISIAKCVETGALDQVRTERDIMARMDTPFIVHFVGAFADKANIFFVMEAVTGGHLFGLLCDHSDVLFSDSRPRGSAAMFYIACVTLALGHLHERFIAYRDIKMENVLLDSCGYAKLCDMGFARFVLGKTNTFLGTPDYMAPEIIDPPHAHDKNVDWFALGVLACELLTGQGPWDYHAESCGNPLEMMLAIRECHSVGLPAGLLPGRQPQAQDLITQLLREKPRSRLGSGQGDAAEVTQHRWFSSAGFDFQALRERRVASPWTPPAGSAEPEPQDGAAPERRPLRGWAMNGGQVHEFV